MTIKMRFYKGTKNVNPLAFHSKKSGDLPNLPDLLFCLLYGGPYRPAVCFGRCAVPRENLQHPMGHSDVSVTMNTYTHIKFDDAAEELRRLEDFRKAQSEIEKQNDPPLIKAV